MNEFTHLYPLSSKYAKSLAKVETSQEIYIIFLG